VSESIDFERVVQAHGPTLWRLTAAHARTRADREDLYQEILTAVWRALPRFEGQSALTTYLYRIATNRGLSWRARHGRHAAEVEAQDTIHDPSPDPSEFAARRAERERLADAVRALPAALAQTVALFLEGLSHREIAEVLGITENNVAVRMNRARAALARVLVEQEER
jgi:RNA polymerase sigma factor (sigma-70 family)